MIDEKTIQDFRNRITAECQPERIILFGSYAYGTPEADSDLDILVIVDHGDSGPKKAAEILSRINPRFPVDLVVRTGDEVKSRLQADDFFLAEILNHGRVLYEAPNP
jgi:uncharacterized protein